MHLEAHVPIPFVSWHGRAWADSVSTLASLAEQRRQRLTQERETWLGFRRCKVGKNKNQTWGKDSTGAGVLLKEDCPSDIREAEGSPLLKSSLSSLLRAREHGSG